MPGRVSTRTARATVRSSKSTPKSNLENNASDVPDEGPTTSLRLQVCAVFSEVQRSNTGQRKLVVGLRKIQEACCYEPTSAKRSNTIEGDYDEEDFNAEVLRSVIRILPVKKSEPVGDGIVRFLGLFLKHATDAGAWLLCSFSSRPFVLAKDTTQITLSLRRVIPTQLKVMQRHPAVASLHKSSR